METRLLWAGTPLCAPLLPAPPPVVPQLLWDAIDGRDYASPTADGRHQCRFAGGCPPLPSQLVAWLAACDRMLHYTQANQQLRFAAVGCWVLGVGCWVLGVGCWVLGCWGVGVLGVGTPSPEPCANDQFTC
jgi:hypothetical protein